jgi:Dolichyl-phosphate-mannose-protein mannosyltransferase
VRDPGIGVLGSARQAFGRVVSAPHATSFLAMAAVLAGAGLVRFWGIGFGLPYRYHIDEQGWVAYGGLLCSGQFDFPAWTAGPNLMHILVCGGDILVFVGGLIGGMWSSISGFRQAYEADPTLVYLTSRSISALVGTFTPMLTYLLGRKLWGHRVGLAASVLMAFTFLHARDSHYVVSDILVTGLLTASLVFCAHSFPGGTLRDLVLAGWLAGLATGVKFTLGVAALPVAAAYLFWRSEQAGGQPTVNRRVGRQLLAIGGAFALGFLIGYPNLIKAAVDFQTFSRDLVSEWLAAQTRGGLWEIDSVPGWLFYGKALGWGMGWPLAALSMAGVALAVWKRSRQDILLLAFLLPFFLFLGSRPYVTAHYMIPLLPLLALLAARVLVAAAGKVAGSAETLGRALAVAVPILLLPSVQSIVQFDALLEQVDTRTVVKEWFEAHIEEGASVAMSLYASWEPPLSTAENPQPMSERRYRVEAVGGLGGVTDVDFQEIQERGFDYLVLSNYVYGIPLRDPARQSAREAFLLELGQQSQRVFVARPYSGSQVPPFQYDQVYGPWTSMGLLDRPGPVIEVFQLHVPAAGRTGDGLLHPPAETSLGLDGASLMAQ